MNEGLRRHLGGWNGEGTGYTDERKENGYCGNLHFVGSLFFIEYTFGIRLDLLCEFICAV